MTTHIFSLTVMFIALWALVGHITTWTDSWLIGRRICFHNCFSGLLTVYGKFRLPIVPMRDPFLSTQQYPCDGSGERCRESADRSAGSLCGANEKTTVVTSGMSMDISYDIYVICSFHSRTSPDMLSSWQCTLYYFQWWKKKRMIFNTGSLEVYSP